MTSPIIERFHQHVSNTPDKTALVFANDSLTYQALNDKVNRLSASFVVQGVKPGDKIGIVLPNSIEFVVIMLAAAKIGAAIVPNNISLPATALAKAFRAVETTHFIVWHSLIEDLKNEMNGANAQQLWVSVGRDKSDTHSFETLCQAQHETAVHDEVAEDQAFIFTMTSGSTGQPKPIVLSQWCKIQRAEAAIALYDIIAEDVILAATPLYHSLAERLVLLPLITGGTSVIMSGFTAATWLEIVAQHRVTFTIAVSSQLRGIEPLLADDKVDLSSLRCISSSSERLPTELKDSLLKKLRCDFHECYGASEVAIVSNLDQAQAKRKIASVGKPIPGVDVVILDETGNQLPADSIGEIACKTPMLFSGYYRQPQKTQDAMSGQYFLTGDLGKLDSEGFLYFCGRKKEIIITGGINVYPKDVEDRLNEHPKVSEVAVVPYPDDKFGEIVTAVIVSEEDIKERELQRFCLNALADFQQPRKYVFVDSLPKNAMGKVLKTQLAQSLSMQAETEVHV